MNRWTSETLAARTSKTEGTVVSLELAGQQPGISGEERRRRHETRSAWLRVAVFAILIANLLVGEHDGNPLVHLQVLVAYALATGLALGLALTGRSPLWSGPAFVVVDAALVVAMLHEHLFEPPGRLDHRLTTTSLRRPPDYQDENRLARFPT